MGEQYTPYISPTGVPFPTKEEMKAVIVPHAVVAATESAGTKFLTLFLGLAVFAAVFIGILLLASVFKGRTG